MKLLAIIDRIEGFASKMGTSFCQACLGELEIITIFHHKDKDYKDGRGRRVLLLFLFEDVLVFARKRQDSKKRLFFEQKVLLELVELKVNCYAGSEEGEIVSFVLQWVASSLSCQASRFEGEAFIEIFQKQKALLLSKDTFFKMNYQKIFKE